MEDLVGMRALLRLAASGRESTPGGERDDGGWHDRPMSSRTPPPPRPVPAGSADEPASGSVAAALGEDVARAGYYPELVAGCLEVALAGEEPVAHLVQAETSFADAVHRHLTVLALTPGRLIIVHVDDAALEDGVPGAVATSEAVPVRRISSLALSRGVARPAAGGGRLVEMTIAISWGAVRRLDLEPASCPDPACQADHGLTGTSVPDDIVVRVAAGVEGDEALERAEAFARALSRATARSAVDA